MPNVGDLAGNRGRRGARGYGDRGPAGPRGDYLYDRFRRHRLERRRQLVPQRPGGGCGQPRRLQHRLHSVSTSANVSAGTTITIGQIQDLNTGNWTIIPGTATGGFILDDTGGTANPTGGTDAFIGTTSTGAITVAPAITIANTTLDIGTVSSGNVTLSGSISGGESIIIKDNGSGTTTLSSSINNTGSITNSSTGSGGLTISGSIGGKVTTITQNTTTSGLTLSGSNAGAVANIILEQGTLTLSNAAALGTGTLTINGATTLTAGAALSLTTNAPMNWNGLWTYNSNTLTLGTGAVTLGGENVGIITNTTNNLTVGGNISGAASLTKTGPCNGPFTNMGAIVLNGTNSYTGGTIIQQGQVQFGSSASLPSTGSVLLAPLGPNSAGYEGAAMVTNYAISQSDLDKVSPASVGVVALGATSGNNLNFAAGGANLPNVSLGAQGSFTYSGTFTPWSSAANAGYYLGGSGNQASGANSMLTISSPLANAGSIPTSVTVDPAFAGFGPGNVTLSGSNTYTGQTRVSTGTLTVTGTLSSSTALSVGAGGTFAYSPTVTGSTQSVSGFTANPGISFVSVNGATNTLSFGAVARNGYGVVAFNGGGLTGGIATTTAADSSGQILGAAYLYNSGASATYAAVSGGMLSGLTYAASPAGTQGTLITDAGANLASQTTNYCLNTVPGTPISSAGSANTLCYTASAGTITLSGATFTSNGILNAGAGVLSIVNTGSGNVVIGATKELVLNTANNGITITAPIVDSLNGPSVVTINGGNAVTLSGSNTYSGGTVLDQGILALANATAGSASLGTGPLTLAGGTFENINSGTAISISNKIIVAQGTTTLVNPNSNNITFTGPLTGAGTMLVGDGGTFGTMYLNGDDSGFTGTIIYNAGNTGGDNFQMGGTQLSNDLGGATFIGENQGGRRLNLGSGVTVQVGALEGSVTLIGGGGTDVVQAGSLNMNFVFSGSCVTQALSLTKVGTGTMTMNSIYGWNLNGGSVQPNNGTLLVDLSNIPSAANFFSSGGPVNLNGDGKMIIRGKDTTLQNSSQAFGALTVNPASASLVCDANGGSGTVITFGAITRNPGGVVDFTLPSGTQSATNGITSTAINTPVITQNTINSVAFATVNGGAGWAAWAGTSGAQNIIPLASYTTNAFSGGNTDVTGGTTAGPGTTELTLRFNVDNVALSLAGSNQVVYGGVLTTPNCNTLGATISGGSLQTGGGNEFVFADYGLLTVSSQLINNSTTALTKAGSGTLILSNTGNTYSGVNYLNGGITKIAADGSLGASTSSAAVSFNGGTLQLAAGYASTLFSNNRGIGIGYDGGTIDTGGNNVVYNGVISSPNASTGANSNYDGQFTFTKAGSGSLKLTGANTYYGATTIAGGTLSVAGILTESSSGGVASGIGESPNYARGLILNGGVLQYTGTATTTDRLFTLGDNGGGLDASGSGAIDFSNAGNVAFPINSTGGPTDGSPTLTLSGSNAGANILAAAIGNNGLGTTSLVKNGAGSWMLTGVNSYSGTTTVNGGTLQLAGAGTFGAGSASLTVNSGAAVAPAIFQSAVTLSGSGAKLSLTNSDSFPAVGTTRSAVGSLNFGGTTGAWTGLANLGGTGIAITGATITTNSAGRVGRPHDPQPDHPGLQQRDLGRHGRDHELAGRGQYG